MARVGSVAIASLVKRCRSLLPACAALTGTGATAAGTPAGINNLTEANLNKKLEELKSGIQEETNKLKKELSDKIDTNANNLKDKLSKDLTATINKENENKIKVLADSIIQSNKNNSQVVNALYDNVKNVYTSINQLKEELNEKIDTNINNLDRKVANIGEVNKNKANVLANSMIWSNQHNSIVFKALHDSIKNIYESINQLKKEIKQVREAQAERKSRIKRMEGKLHSIESKLQMVNLPKSS